MTKQEANKLLDASKGGKPVPPHLITQALFTTGDIHGKLSSPDSSADSGGTDSDSPFACHAVVQNLE
jgi:hypothetical protein